MRVLLVDLDPQANATSGLGLAQEDGGSLYSALVDGTDPDPAESWRIIRGELAAYGGGLDEKPEVLALNKCDSLTPDEIKDRMAALKKISGAKVFPLSGVSGVGLKPVLGALLDHILAARGENPGVLAASSAVGRAKRPAQMVESPWDVDEDDEEDWEDDWENDDDDGQ